MPRILSAAGNSLRLIDNLSGSQIEFYYRLPTTREHTAFQNECIQRKGRKVVNRYPETRLKYGMKILTGIRPGDFEIDDGAGGTRPIASDNAHKDFLADWRDHVEKYAGDLVQLLAAHVFETPASIDDQENGDKSIDDQDDDEDIEPD